MDNQLSKDLLASFDQVAEHLINHSMNFQLAANNMQNFIENSMKAALELQSCIPKLRENVKNLLSKNLTGIDMNTQENVHIENPEPITIQNGHASDANGDEIATNENGNSNDSGGSCLRIVKIILDDFRKPNQQQIEKETKRKTKKIKKVKDVEAQSNEKLSSTPKSDKLNIKKIKAKQSQAKCLDKKTRLERENMNDANESTENQAQLNAPNSHTISKLNSPTMSISKSPSNSLSNLTSKNTSSPAKPNDRQSNVKQRLNFTQPPTKFRRRHSMDTRISRIAVESLKYIPPLTKCSNKNSNLENENNNGADESTENQAQLNAPDSHTISNQNLNSSAISNSKSPSNSSLDLTSKDASSASVEKPKNRQSNVKRKLNFTQPPPKFRRRHSVDTRTSRISAHLFDNIKLNLPVVCNINDPSDVSTNLPNSMPTDEHLLIPKNTDLNKHSKHDIYQKYCLFCNTQSKSLVSHYAKEHPEHEIPIVRPSPELASALKKQEGIFIARGGKIETRCYFCNELRSMTKSEWSDHYLAHTGEAKLLCSDCDHTANNHEQICSGNVSNIFEMNSKTSLMAFICIACNYVQVRLTAIKKHLTNEHGYDANDEGHRYEKVFLVPDLSPIQSNMLTKFNSIDVSKRYSCTACDEQFIDVDHFMIHFDKMHKAASKYECICGEMIKAKDDQLNGKLIADHLSLHSSDLFQCMACEHIYTNGSVVLNHLINEHRGIGNKYHHLCHRKSSVSERTVQKFKCKGSNMCNSIYSTLDELLDHFQTKHQSDDVKMALCTSKKVSYIGPTPNEITVTYHGNKEIQWTQPF